jgi:hypothetical protein
LVTYQKHSVCMFLINSYMFWLYEAAITRL